MNRGLLAIFLLTCSLPAFPASDLTTRSFSEDNTNDMRVLSNVEHKAIVAEFLDPLNTGIGKSIAYLLWREVLSAISDQSGAGVILARPPGDERLIDLLRKDYHTAALRIAEHQDARMALWGIVNELNDQIFVSTHLSLVEATRGNAISYTITRTRRDISNGDKVAFEGKVEFTMPRTKLNFPTLRTSRKELFQRPLMVARKSNVRAMAYSSSEQIGQLQQGDVIQGIDMTGGWFKLRLPDGREGFITASNVDLAPLSVRIDRYGINLRSRPVVQDDTVVYSGRVNGQYRVLEHSFTGHRLWYRINYASDQPVWVAASLTETVYSMPVVHFVAGMYRYFAGRHGDTRREFQRFADFPGVKHRNVNLSVAYQYQALSNLLEGRSADSGIRFLKKARAQTPLDATIYKIEALTLIGERGAATQISDSLQKARELDPRVVNMKVFENFLDMDGDF